VSPAGAIHFAKSVACATPAPSKAEVFITVAAWAIAMIYLVKPDLQKDERLQCRIER
jgi:hypothetical protein